MLWSPPFLCSIPAFWILFCERERVVWFCVKGVPAVAPLLYWIEVKRFLYCKPYVDSLPSCIWRVIGTNSLWDAAISENVHDQIVYHISSFPIYLWLREYTIYLYLWLRGDFSNTNPNFCCEFGAFLDLIQKVMHICCAVYCNLPLKWTLISGAASSFLIAPLYVERCYRDCLERCNSVEVNCFWNEPWLHLTPVKNYQGIYCCWSLFRYCAKEDQLWFEESH